MQLTLGDAEDMGKHKRIRKEIFLDEMEQVVPWAPLLTLIEPHYPKKVEKKMMNKGYVYLLATLFLVSCSSSQSYGRQPQGPCKAND